MNTRSPVIHLRFRSRMQPSEVDTRIPSPTRKDVTAFHLPRDTHPTALPQLAERVALEELGVHVPDGVSKPDFFEAGFRQGLSSNRLTRFQLSYRAGFLCAKVFWRKFAPRHRLAALGGGQFRNTVVW